MSISGLSVPSRTSGHASDQPYDNTDNSKQSRIFDNDGLHVAVFRNQGNLVPFPLQPLHRRLILDHGHHDIAILCLLLRLHDDVVAGADVGLDHAVPLDLEHEVAVTLQEPRIHGQSVLDVLLSQKGRPRRNLADQWDARPCRTGADSTQLDAARPVTSPADESLAFQSMQMIRSRPRAPHPKLGADLAEGRRVAVLLQMTIQVVVNSLLPSCQALHGTSLDGLCRKA